MQNYAWLSLAAALVSGLTLTSCDDGDGEPCADFTQRDPAPYCDGVTGSTCRSDRDCDELCCRDKHCGSAGLCSFSCRSDRDCPAAMLCEHDVCLFACDSDRDCAVGWRCEHGGRVCEAE